MDQRFPNMSRLDIVANPGDIRSYLEATFRDNEIIYDILEPDQALKERIVASIIQQSRGR